MLHCHAGSNGSPPPLLASPLSSPTTPLPRCAAATTKAAPARAMRAEDAWCSSSSSLDRQRERRLRPWVRLGKQRSPRTTSKTDFRIPR
jgi:hypothetical protein